jgi:hypothetical protein
MPFKVPAKLDTMRSASAKELRSGFSCSRAVRYCVCAITRDVKAENETRESRMMRLERSVNKVLHALGYVFHTDLILLSIFAYASHRSHRREEGIGNEMLGVAASRWLCGNVKAPVGMSYSSRGSLYCRAVTSMSTRLAPSIFIHREARSRKCQRFGRMEIVDVSQEWLVSRAELCFRLRLPLLIAVSIVRHPQQHLM